MMHYYESRVQLYFGSHNTSENCHELAVTCQLFLLSCQQPLLSPITYPQSSKEIKKDHEGFPNTKEDYHIIYNNCLKAKDGKLVYAFFLYCVSLLCWGFCLVWLGWVWFFLLFSFGIYFYSLPPSLLISSPW